MGALIEEQFDSGAPRGSVDCRNEKRYVTQLILLGNYYER